MATKQCSATDGEWVASGVHATPIPTIVHQSWRTRSVPANLQPLHQAWQALPKPWQHWLWTDEDNRQLWAKHFPRLLAMYDNYSRPVQRADATRLLYMYVHGGIYADLDTAPCRSLLATHTRLSDAGISLAMVREPSKNPRFKDKNYLTNFWVASSKGHPFWLHAIEKLPHRASHPSVMSSTGPYFLNHAWATFKERWSGTDCGDELQRRARVFSFDAWQIAVGSHHWASMWHSKDKEGVSFSMDFVLWRGVNMSRNCPEAAFEKLVMEQWACKNLQNPCARKTWRAFLDECDGNNNHCPESFRKRKMLMERKMLMGAHSKQSTRKRGFSTPRPRKRYEEMTSRW